METLPVPNPVDPTLPALDAAAPYPPEVQIVELGERRFVLVGTAHISRSSVDLVRQVITAEKPDCVCVELDPQRYEALARKRQWEALDLKQVIRRNQLTTLLVNLILASYQRRLGGKLGVEPGTELLEATRVAEELGIPFELCDRDVRVTLRRGARVTSTYRKFLLLSHLLASLLDTAEVTEEQLQQLKQQDVLTEMMHELGRFLPALKRVLIDERDAYLTARMKQAPGRNIVAVVGAGHLEGIRTTLLEEREVDLAELDFIPRVSRIWKFLGWALPALVIGTVAWIGLAKGTAVAGALSLYWLLATGLLSGAGAILALSHPLTILTAFFAAPITALTPVVGAGHITALVQAWVEPPVVREFQTVVDDASKLRQWWKNRLLRVFLAFLLPSVGSMIGVWLASVKIVSKLF